MRWQAKAVLQRAIGALPASEQVNYLLQRHVSRSLPVSLEAFRRKSRRANGHFEAFLEHCGSRAPDAAAFYEFGAGWDLAVPLALWSFGVDRQVVTDVSPHIRPELVDTVIRRLAETRSQLEDETGRAVRAPDRTELEGLDGLRERFGIDYLAPRDASATGLPAASIDVVTSTNTLEHVPESALLPLLRECRRLLRPDGVMSCRIDLSDHYSHFDRNASAYNFLRYSDRRWRLYNSPLMYQSRLRRPDYLNAFAEAGFLVLSERATGPTDDDLAELAGLDLAPEFADRYSTEDLGVRALALVVRPRPEADGAYQTSASSSAIS